MVKIDDNCSENFHKIPLWGWVKVVYEMKESGNSDKEIANFLLSKDIPKTQIGILLYPTANVVQDWRQVTDGILEKKGK